MNTADADVPVMAAQTVESDSVSDPGSDVSSEPASGSVTDSQGSGSEYDSDLSGSVDDDMSESDASEEALIPELRTVSGRTITDVLQDIHTTLKDIAASLRQPQQ